MPFLNFYKVQFAERLNAPLQSHHGRNDFNCNAFPLALSQYYQVAGLHPINSSHNQLLAPEQTYELDDYLVFAHENQEVVVWSMSLSESSADPLVYQGQYYDGKYTWYSEEQTFSHFIIAMWDWQKENGLI